MPEINQKGVRADKILPLTPRFSRCVVNLTRKIFALCTLVGFTILLAGSFGCAPPASQNDAKQNASADSNDLPEITEEMIREKINNTYVSKVPEESGSAEPIGWNFYKDEPKEINIVEKQIEGNSATLLLDIRTSSAPKSREPRILAGQIRTRWELKTGWALRTWEIVETVNISMKYRKLPKPPPAQYSNR